MFPWKQQKSLWKYRKSIQLYRTKREVFLFINKQTYRWSYIAAIWKTGSMSCGFGWIWIKLHQACSCSVHVHHQLSHYKYCSKANEIPYIWEISQSALYGIVAAVLYLLPTEVIFGMKKNVTAVWLGGFWATSRSLY